MKIGYARVSTDDQNLDLQIDALNAAGCAQIYKEYASGKNTKIRPELANCLKSLRAGDTLVVWRLDRLGRNVTDLIKIVADLEKVGIELVDPTDKNAIVGVAFKSIKEEIDTTTSAGKLIFHIFASLAEFERDLIRERTVAGLKAARARGRLGGRPPKLSEIDVTMAKLAIKDNKTPIQDIAKNLNVSRTTLYRRIGKSFFNEKK